MISTRITASALPLDGFIQELLRRSQTSHSTLQVALFYLLLLKGKQAGLHAMNDEPEQLRASACRTLKCGRRMFLAALMLASKYLQDRNHSTRAWSKICGLRVREINKNETAYLKCIDHDLHIKKDVFENWSRIVITRSKLSKLNAIMCGTEQLPDPDCDAFSTQWWTSLFQKLSLDIVMNAELTETFLGTI